MSLLERMRAARENWVPIADGKALCLLRPRFEDLRHFKVEVPSKLVAMFTVNWRGVTEADLVTSGGSDPEPFDVEVLAEWLADKPEYCDKASSWLIKAGEDRVAALGTAEKN